MASSGNTWQKKLMAKGKKFSLGKKLGTFKPRSLASTLDATKEIIKVKPCDRDISHNISAKLKRGRSGCRLNAATRAIIAQRRVARDTLLGRAAS